MKKGFTLIEILVVATILVLLAGLMVTSYSTLLKSSRDGKRKADIESIRGALEILRSNNNGTYPASTYLNFSVCSGASLIDSLGNTYMSPLPNDPQCSSGMKYRYIPGANLSSYDLYAAQESTGVGTSYHATPYGSQ